MRRYNDDQELRAQIKTTIARTYSTDDIEARIARALVAQGHFRGELSSGELEIILRNIVYVLFTRQKVAGMDVNVLHNVPIMNVDIKDGEAHVAYVVHIHKPIIVFIEFEYTLINDPDFPNTQLCLKEGSLRVKEKTRRFDLKAKAAMAALNVPRIARQEMTDTTGIIRKTLPDQLRKRGLEGQLDQIHLSLNGDTLGLYLRGVFRPVPQSENDEVP